MLSVFVNPMNRTRSNVSAPDMWTVTQVSYLRMPRTAIVSGFAPPELSRLSTVKNNASAMIPRTAQKMPTPNVLNVSIAFGVIQLLDQPRFRRRSIRSPAGAIARLPSNYTTRPPRSGGASGSTLFIPTACGLEPLGFGKSSERSTQYAGSASDFPWAA